MNFSTGRLVTIACFLLSITGLLQLIRGFLALFSPLVLDYTEMMLVGGTWQLQHNGLQAVYSPPNLPYNLPGVQYPPLFMLLMDWLNRLSGLSLVGASRFWSFGGYVVAALLAALIVRELRGRTIPVFPSLLLAFALPFCFWPVIIFIHTARVDPLALSFNLLAVWLYLRWQPATGRYSVRPLLAVATLLALGLLTKQTFLAASAAVFFHLLLHPLNRFRAFLFGISLAVLVAVGYGLTGLLSNGAFFEIFDPARAGRFIFHLAPGMIFYFLADHLPLFLLAIPALLALWKTGWHGRFLPLYALFSTLSLVTIFKDGAIDYYFTELAYIISIAVTTLVIDYQYPKTPQLYINKKIIEKALPAGLFIQFVIGLGMLVGWSQGQATANFTEAYREGTALVKENAGNPAALILADGPLIENDQSDRVGDYLVYSILLTTGKRSSQELAKNLTNGRWQLLVTVTPDLYRWPENVAQALEKNYKLQVLRGKDGTGLYWVYRRN